MSDLEERQTYPTKAEFHCAPYDDGSGHQIKIGYDLNNGAWSKHIMIDDYAITFEVQYAEEVIEAIRQCAAAIRARQALGEAG